MSDSNALETPDTLEPLSRKLINVNLDSSDPDSEIVDSINNLQGIWIDGTFLPEDLEEANQLIRSLNSNDLRETIMQIIGKYTNQINQLRKFDDSIYDLVMQSNPTLYLLAIYSLCIFKPELFVVHSDTLGTLSPDNNSITINEPPLPPMEHWRLSDDKTNVRIKLSDLVILNLLVKHAGTSKVIEIDATSELNYKIKLNIDEVAYSSHLRTPIGTFDINRSPIAIELDLKKIGENQFTLANFKISVVTQSLACVDVIYENSKLKYCVKYPDNIKGYPTYSVTQHEDSTGVRSFEIDDSGIVTSIVLDSAIDPNAEIIKQKLIGSKFEIDSDGVISFKGQLSENIKAEVSGGMGIWEQGFFEKYSRQSELARIFSHMHANYYTPVELIKNSNEYKKLIEDLTLDSSDIAILYIAEYLSFLARDNETLKKYFEQLYVSTRVRLLESYLFQFWDEYSYDARSDVYNYFINRIKSGEGTGYLLSSEGQYYFAKAIRNHIDDKTGNAWEEVYRIILKTVAQGTSGIKGPFFETILMVIHHNGFTLDRLLTDGKQADTKPYKAMFVWHNLGNNGLKNLWNLLPKEVKSFVRSNDHEMYLDMQKLYYDSSRLTSSDLDSILQFVERAPDSYQREIKNSLIDFEDNPEIKKQLIEIFSERPSL